MANIRGGGNDHVAGFRLVIISPQSFIIELNLQLTENDILMVAVVPCE